MAFGIPEAPCIALLTCIGFKCQCTSLARGQNPLFVVVVFSLLKSITTQLFPHMYFEGHPPI